MLVNGDPGNFLSILHVLCHMRTGKCLLKSLDINEPHPNYLRFWCFFLHQIEVICRYLSYIL